MKIRYIAPKISILLLAVGILICWTVAGKAYELWDAKTSARVNLRRNPSSNGVILSIVPKDHKVRIIEKKGLWYKVGVEGEIHGKGWVYAEYVEEILPKAIESESALQTVRVEIESGEQEQKIDPAEPPSKALTEDEQKKPLNTASSGKAFQIGVTEQPTIRNEFRDGKDNLIAVSKRDVPMVRKPAHILTIQPPQSGVKSRALGAIEKASSEVPIQGDIFPHFKNLPGKKKEPGTAGQRKPLGVKERTVPISPAIKENAIQRQAVSHEKKGLLYKQQSIGLVELTLKLLSITLSCLVILFLHRANKIATNRYDAALRQFQ
jgi:hypothetical protein